MVSRRREVLACAPELDERVDRRLCDFGVKSRQIGLERAGTNPIHDLRRWAGMSRDLREIRPDNLLCYTIKPVIYGTLAGAEAGVPDRYAGVEGFLVPTMDAAALEAAMMRFVDAPDLANRMAPAARKRAVDKYDVHKVNGRMLEIMGL